MNKQFGSCRAKRTTESIAVLPLAVLTPWFFVSVENSHLPTGMCMSKAVKIKFKLF